MAAHLAQRLDQRWTLIAGYRNAKGEVDQLLVGPAGIVAIEIKFVNGRVSCDGDSWWRDKYDRYGNLVERAVPIADKRGRGPSRQVNEVADLLERQLRKCDPQLPRIIRSVVLSHDKSQVGDIRNSTVDIVTTLSGWNVHSLPAATVLSEDRVVRIIDSVCREHQLFDKPSRPRKGSFSRSVSTD